MKILILKIRIVEEKLWSSLRSIHQSPQTRYLCINGLGMLTPSTMYSLTNCIARYSKRTWRSIHELSSANKSLGDGILSGDRSCLARSITLIESTRSDHQIQANLLLRYLASSPNKNNPGFQNGKTLRLGIAGPPGGGFFNRYPLIYLI